MTCFLTHYHKIDMVKFRDDLLMIPFVSALGESVSVLYEQYVNNMWSQPNAG